MSADARAKRDTSDAPPRDMAPPARAGWSARGVECGRRVSSDKSFLRFWQVQNLGKSSVAHNTVLGSNRVEPTDGVIIFVFPFLYNNLLNLGSSTLESPKAIEKVLWPNG